MTISREDLDAGRADLSDAVDPEGESIGPVHPGEILRSEWLEPLDLTPYRLAQEIGVPPNRVTEILNGRRAISADTALRLARFFGTDAQSWLNLQARHDLETARRTVGAEIERRVRPMRAA